MSARTWREDDPEPADHPAVVDADDVAWVWRDDDESVPNTGIGYHQQLITHYGNGPLVGMGSICNEWREIFSILPRGSVLREATADEAETWVERWTA